MPPLAIVEQFDVFEDFASCLGSGVPVALITQFEFEGGEKTLGHRVIPAISFTAHAAQQTMRRQQLLILVAGVLAPAVPVMQQALWRLAILQRHLKRVQREPRSSRSLRAQPTTRRENRSRITARYNQPSKVHR